jgi:putative ABC transport system substrate-binding protein
VRLKVDIIVTASTVAALAAKQRTGTIPIVLAGTGDSVATGFVASLARPGGNVTGLSALSPELMTKQLEPSKKSFPKSPGWRYHTTRVTRSTYPHAKKSSL